MRNLQNSNRTKSKEYINEILNQNYIRHWIVAFRIIGTDYTCETPPARRSWNWNLEM